MDFVRIVSRICFTLELTIQLYDFKLSEFSIKVDKNTILSRGPSLNNYLYNYFSKEDVI